MPPVMLPAAVRAAQPSATMPHVVYIATAGLLLLVVAIFAVMLMLQRRRRRAQILLALAAEEAERRRKKRKRAGLRTAEIERYCPELIVVPPGTISRDVSDDETDHADTDAADQPEDDLGDLSKSDTTRAATAKLKEKQESLALEDVRSADSQPEERVPLPIELEEGNEVCVVCLDEMVVDERVRRLPCSHVYHSSCIRLWLRRKNACPCCCKTVVKRKRRKKKKPRINLDPGVSSNSNNLTEPPPLPDLPVEPPRAASFSSRRPHRTGSAVRIFGHSRSMPCVDTPSTSPAVNIGGSGTNRDRPRPPGTESFLRTASDAFSRPTGNPFPRTGSLLDPDDPNSEVLNSEASSHFDEQMANQLLDHVRQVLRGEIVMGDEYSTDGEMSDACLDDDDSFLLLDNVQLNNPFRGHAASMGVPRPNISRDIALTRQRQHSRLRQGPGEMEENLSTPQRRTRNV